MNDMSTVPEDQVSVAEFKKDPVGHARAHRTPFVVSRYRKPEFVVVPIVGESRDDELANARFAAGIEEILAVRTRADIERELAELARLREADGPVEEWDPWR